MKKKLFRLPKTFATKWLEALRSGEYKQTDGVLLDFEEYDGSPKYCCLGVAGSLCKVAQSYLVGSDFFNQNHLGETKLPEELIGVKGLPHVLSSLNDGVVYHDAFNEYTFRDSLLDEFIQLDFNQIANFIEDNVEFY